jgi:hypothetical protein
MVVAMTAVLIVQMTGHVVVNVTGVRHGFVPAGRRMPVRRVVRAAVMPRGALDGVLAAGSKLVFVGVPFVCVMEVSIVKIVDVTVML